MTDSWATSIYYFETSFEGKVLRQIEVYANGQKLKYDLAHLQDEYGGLSDVPLDLEEFAEFEINHHEFEEIWR